MLIAQQLFLLGIAELPLGRRRGIRNGFLPHATAAHEDLRLQQKLAFARFALHVVNRLTVLYVSIEAENHKKLAIAQSGNCGIRARSPLASSAKHYTIAQAPTQPIICSPASLDTRDFNHLI